MEGERVHSTVRNWEDPHSLKDKRDATGPSCTHFQRKRERERVISYFRPERDSLLSSLLEASKQQRGDSWLHPVRGVSAVTAKLSSGKSERKKIKTGRIFPATISGPNVSVHSYSVLVCTVFLYYAFISLYVCVWFVGLCFQSILPSRGQCS